MHDYQLKPHQHIEKIRPRVSKKHSYPDADVEDEGVEHRDVVVGARDVHLARRQQQPPPQAGQPGDGAAA